MRQATPVTPDTKRSEFAALALAHLDAACNLARWLIKDARAAEDVVQDAMVRALTYFHTFRGENPRAWLLQIVRNTALSRMAANNVATSSLDARADVSEEAAVELIDPTQGPEAIAMREQDQQLITRLLANLPVELRECLILRELEDLSYKEIARIIDAPIGTVMSRLWRGRQMLMQAANAAGSNS